MILSKKLPILGSIHIRECERGDLNVKSKIKIIIAGLLVFSVSAYSAPLKNFAISYTFKNADGSVFRIIKYYLNDGLRFRSEYYSPVKYNISARAEAQTGDSVSKVETHTELQPESSSGKLEPHTIEILRKDKELVWSIDPSYKQYFEVPLRQDPWERATTEIFLTDSTNIKKTGETKLLDYPCNIYENVQKVDKDTWTNIFYVTQGSNIIMKNELLQNGNLIQIMEATEFSEEQPASSLFEVPEGYKKFENN